jgi:cytochrome c oxidase cbb3-type subunit III
VKAPTVALSLGVAALLGVILSAQDPAPSPPAGAGQAPVGSPAPAPQGRGRGGQGAQGVPGAPARGGGFGRGRAFDQAAIDRAKPVFSVQCGFCHGDDARGRSAGPDLARSLVVLGDTGGKDLGAYLRTGRPPVMPAFPNLTDAQIEDIAEFLHMTLEAAKSRALTDAMASLVGDAKAGEAYFNGAGKCSSCHSVTGDLAHIGTKYGDPPALQDRMVNPRPGGGRGGQATASSPRSQRTATVTLANGQTVSGTLETLSEFIVTIVDQSGKRRTFTRDGETPKVAVTDPLQAHYDLLRTFRDKDMQDLTAYLWTLK